MRALLAFLTLLAATLPATAANAVLTARQQQSREIYRQLVEINTAPEGDTLAAAQAMAAHLMAAGMPAADVQVLQSAPRRGNLVARLRGNGRQRPLLLLAHLDVVEARREDWSTDPFKLVEKDGYFHGRGTQDDKYMAASFVNNLIRYQREGYRPDRDLILVLSTDEENGDEHQLGIRWLLANHRTLIDAELALNEGATVGVRNGKAIWNAVQTSEKRYQDFWLEVRNRGGHSAQPRADNAIYALSLALGKLASYQFPLELNATTRLYFERMAGFEKPEIAADMRSLLQALPDSAAVARLSAIPGYNALMRTTCVATRVDGGHADNALPQLARALLNCRILPGHSVDEVQQTLSGAIGNAEIRIVPAAADTASDPSPLDPQLMTAITDLSKKFWPGTVVVPVMGAGATDSRFLRNAGIRAYGHSGLAADIDDVRTHGRDERVSVQAFHTGQEYLYQLVKLLAGGR